MKLTEEMIKQLEKDLENCTTAEDLLGQKGVIKNLVRGLSEQILEAEMTHHLGYEKYAPEGQNSGNSRNGKSSKTVQSDAGEMQLDIPRSQQYLRAHAGTKAPAHHRQDRWHHHFALCQRA
ncbi:MAG TPA: transposase, partial [bacterium]|nr:transposase [bacterium]